VVEAPVDAHDVLVDDGVDGVDLARLLAARGRPGLPVAGVLAWMAQAAEALSDIHDNGGVHGDVRPANLVLDQQGQVVLVGAHRDGTPTNTSAFRAPEVDAGATPDQAADVYGLAATTFVLLTGVAPTGAVSIPGGDASRLEPALRDALATDPSRRPATPGAFVERMRADWEANPPTDVSTVLVSDVIDKPRTSRLEMQLAVDRAVEDNGGRRLDATLNGNAIVSLFADATNAVRAAVVLLQSLQQSPESLHVGLASGEFAGAPNGEALTGQAVRVMDLAGPGEILLAASTAQLVRPELQDKMRLIEVDGAVAISTVGVNSPPDPRRSPYPGLAAFGQTDSDLFFGREDVVVQCLELLRAERFVAIVGASGSGKSSLLHAGLLPWIPDAVLLRPGEHPQQSLAESGAADRPDAVLVVDQLENLVTLCQSPKERKAFIDNIVDHPGGLAVALRADRYGEFARFGEFAQLLSSCQVLLGQLDDDELTRAVVEPARRCGLAMEDGVPELVATELPNTPGTLPMLGHALREAWVRRDGSTITAAGYRDAGGVRSAIAATAERAYTALDERHQGVARRLLLQMVEMRPDGALPRWISSDEVAGVDRKRAPTVLTAFATMGLIVVDDDKSTVAHEAVLTAWPRLAGWIAAKRAALLVRQGPDEERSRIRRLWFVAIGTSVVALTALAVGVVAVSERDDAIERLGAAQSAGLLADARAAVAADDPDAAMLLAVEARADSPSTAATGTLVDALLIKPSARAFLQGAPSAVQAIAEGERTVAGAAGNDILLWTEDGWRMTGNYQVGDGEISDLAVNDDGEVLVVAIPGDHSLVAVNAGDGVPITAVDYGAMSPMKVVSAGERVLVVVGDRENPATALRVEQRDLRTLVRTGPSLVPPTGLLEVVAVSDDGRQSALATSDGAVWLADLDTGEVDLGAAAPLSDTDVGIDDIAWHDDLLLAGRADGSIDAWRFDTGGKLTKLGSFAAGGPVGAVAAGCDGSCLAAGTSDGRVVAWRIGAEQVPLDVRDAHDGKVTDLEFTADDAFLVSAGSDRLTVAHALDGSLTIAPSVAPGAAPAHGAYGVADTVFSGTDDAERGRIVRYGPSGDIAWRTPVDGAVTWVAAPEGQVVAVVDPPEDPDPVRVMVLDADTGVVHLDEALDGARATGAVSPDGSTVVVAARDSGGSSLATIDLGTLSMSKATTVPDRVTAVSFSPDGSRVVTGHATGEVVLRESESFSAERRSTTRLGDPIFAVGFTPDGTSVLAGGLAGVVDVLDAATLEPRFAPLEGHRRAITSVASNDAIVLSASADGTVRMWDLASGAAIGGPVPTGGTTAPSIALRDDRLRALVQSDRGLLELVLDENEWTRLACTIPGRELTEDERSRYGLAGSANACGSLG
jgi:WD40 repeat protein